MQNKSEETPVSTPAAPASAPRYALRHLLANIPEMLMIGIAIWAMDFAAIISFAGILHAGLYLLIGMAAIFALPALWASWQTLRLALLPDDKFATGS